MIRAFYAAIAAMAAALVALACAASASALTVAPSGDYLMESGNFQWTTTSNGQSLTCDLLSFEFSLDGDGIGEVPIGASWSGCNNSLLGRFTLTQIVDWPLAVHLTASPLRVGATMQIPASGLQFSGAGCTWWVEGTIEFGVLPTSLPAALTGLSIVSSSLRVSRSSGLMCFAWPAGLAKVFTGDFDFDRTLTVSG